MENKIKFCPTCKIEKSISDFCKRKNSSDGFDFQCKECKNEYKRKYRLRNPNKILEYRLKNKKIIKEKELLRNLFYAWNRFYYRAMGLCNNKKIDSYKYYGGRGIKCLLSKKEEQKDK